MERRGERTETDRRLLAIEKQGMGAKIQALEDPNGNVKNRITNLEHLSAGFQTSLHCINCANFEQRLQALESLAEKGGPPTGDGDTSVAEGPSRHVEKEHHQGATNLSS